MSRIGLIATLMQSSMLLADSQEQSPTQNEKLLLFGGGDMPDEGIKKFMEWAGGKQARLLVIPWASGRNPDEILSDFKTNVSKYSPQSVILAPVIADMGSRVKEFTDALANSTAVFFVGGDQNQVMDFLQDHSAVAALLHTAYQNGKPFGGTSAGTAIMSKTMLTGDGDLTVIDPSKVSVRPGLGFLTHVVVDQHFIKRQRLNRLLSVMAGAPEEFALGIDEGAAVAVEGQCRATVLGKLQAIFLQKIGAGRSFNLVVQQPGQTFNLGCTQEH